MVFFPFCVPPCFVFLLHFFVCPSFFFFFFLHSVVLLAVFPYYIIHNGRLFPGFAAVAGYMSLPPPSALLGVVRMVCTCVLLRLRGHLNVSVCDLPLGTEILRPFRH